MQNMRIVFSIVSGYRTKISELNTEVVKLSREMDQFNAENATYLTFEKRFVIKYFSMQSTR